MAWVSPNRYRAIESSSASWLPIALKGTNEQRRRWLPSLSDGTLSGGNGMSEPDSGSDAFSMRTMAVREGDVYRLEGRKTLVSNGPDADVLPI